MKTDFNKDLDCYRAARGVPRVVDVPPLQYLMLDGHGDPNTDPAFAEAVESLYPVAYTLKFASKNDLDRDYWMLHHEFIPSEGLRPTGKHHEIYLSDLRRVTPERQRTILRQPVAPM